MRLPTLAHLVPSPPVRGAAPPHRLATGGLALVLATALAAPTAARAACGDGVPDAGETCDDGNDVAGDGCSASCTVELGYSCTPAGGEVPGAFTNPGFEADDGVTLDASDPNPGDGLVNNHSPIPGWSLDNGTVDLVIAGSTVGIAPEGDQALNLTGSPPNNIAATVSRDLPTVDGDRYLLTYALAEQGTLCGGLPFARTFVSLYAGTAQLLFAFHETTVPADDPTWAEQRTLFDAQSATTTLLVADTTGDPQCGAVVDDFHLYEVSQCEQLDVDDDGLPDVQEDLNGDGILDPGETDPLDADTDDDGLSDLDEVAGTGPLADYGPTDPRNPDTDGDGLLDGTEVGLNTTQSGDTDLAVFRADQDPSTESDPLDDDTDNDGLLDGTEDADGNGRTEADETAPFLADTDGDGLLDGTEVGLAAPEGVDTFGPAFVPDADGGNTVTDPLLADTDGGGVPDGFEDTNGDGALDPGELDPNDPTDDDLDGDGLTGTEEATYGTDPDDADTDDDGLTDDQEVFGTGPLAVWLPTDPTLADTDGDGIDDGTEIGLIAGTTGTDPAGFVPDADAGATVTDPNDDDLDDDGLLDGTEDANGNGATDPGETDPVVRDSDGDGLVDGLEVGLTEPEGDDTVLSAFVEDLDPTSTTDPLDPDTDDGGISDGDEDADGDGVFEFGETDPNERSDDDSDGDGLVDADEVANGTDPNDADSDGDGLDDGDEVAAGSDPNEPDSDGDGLDDFDEVVTHGTDPGDVDTDDDGLTDYDEVVVYGTDPLNPDTDGDGLSDYDEVVTYGTDPLNPDTDGDGISDADEIANGTDPNGGDPDGDGLDDVEEGFYGTDPNDADSDDDGLPDNVEVFGVGPMAPFGPSDPLTFDEDGDGLGDGQELGVTDADVGPDTDPTVFVPDADPSTTTDPKDDDTDDDGLLDGQEDVDRDGAQGADETDPDDVDSDADGILDGTELGLAVPQGDDTDPTVFVPDADGALTFTDPLDPDTDDGGVDDGAEDLDHNGAIDPGETDPNDPADDPDALDSDGDGLTDLEEDLNSNGVLDPGESDPHDVDTDDDGLSDYDEVRGTGPLDDAGADPTAPDLADSDGDGIQDGTEIGLQSPATPEGTDTAVFIPDADPTTTTDPADDDTDDDGLLDGSEDRNADGAVDDGETDPLVADTDADGVQDGTEVGLTAPEGADTRDAVFIPDADPATVYDPLNPDTDEDGLLDGTEDADANGRLDDGETDPLVADSDGDGLLDGAEVDAGTDPLDPDSDGDGYDDGFEQANGSDPLSGVRTQGSGGCAHTGSGASTGPSAPMGLLGLGLLALLGRRRREGPVSPTPSEPPRRQDPAATVRRGVPFTAAAAALLLPLGPAHAQEDAPRLDIQRFDPAPQARGFTLVRNDLQAGPRTFGASLAVHYGLNPLELGISGEGDRSIGLVDHLVGLDLGVVGAPVDWLEIGLAVPVMQAQLASETGQAFAAPLGGDATVGLGDLALTLGFQPLRQDKGAPLSVAIAPRFLFPTGTRSAFVGSGSFEAGADVVVGRRWDAFRFSVTGGYHFHSASAQVGQTYADDEVRWGVGLGVPLLDQQLEIQLEHVGAAVISGEGRSLIGDDFAATHTPMEILLGAQWAPKRLPMWISGGVGRGLGYGFGTPDVRAYAQVGFVLEPRDDTAEPLRPKVRRVGDMDRDGLADDMDACPEQPEDMNGYEDADGCPDGDEDGDGILDLYDDCPNELEDIDLFEDEDGCPEADNDLDGLLDTVDDCPKDPEVFNGVDDEDGCPDGSLAYHDAERDELVLLDRIGFAPGTATLLDDAFPVLDAVGRILAAFPELEVVEVHAYVLGDGPAASRRRLGKERAEAIRGHLIGYGIDGDRMVPVGDANPPDEASSPAASAGESERIRFLVVEQAPMGR